MAKEDPYPTPTEKRLTRLEASVCSLAKILSGFRALPLNSNPELAELLGARWPELLANEQRPHTPEESR